MSQDTAQGEELEQRIDAASGEAEEPQEPTPSSEESLEEPASDNEEHQDVTEEEALANAKNPERTKQYIEKLKEQARQAQQPAKNVFDEFRPTPSASGYENLNQAEVNEIANQYVDEDGNVDVERLNYALQQANQQSQAAVQHSQQAVDKITRYEESRQLQEAYTKYPQLDPGNSKFDDSFYELVSEKIMVENYAKGGALTVVQAADKIAKVYTKPNVEQDKKKAVEDYKKSQEDRQQGPIEKGRGADREGVASDELRERTRRGDDRATAERLKNLGI